VLLADAHAACSYHIHSLQMRDRDVELVLEAEPAWSESLVVGDSKQSNRKLESAEERLAAKAVDQEEELQL
jgi:hypothetical protein